MGAKNGTRVYGDRVSVHCLADGDRLAIGAQLFRVALVSVDSLKIAPAPDESSGRSMTGNIRDIPLADVLQWWATSRKTGTLNVSGAREGSLFLREGRVCFARIDGRDKMGPSKALLRMLGWQEGGFALDSSEVDIPEDKEISPSLESVLMEAARQQDELAHLADRHDLPQGKVRLVHPSPELWSTLEPIQIDLIQAVCAWTRWDDVLDNSNHDDVVLTKAAIALKKKGVVVF